MIGTKLFKHYLNNYKHWKSFKSLPKTHQLENGFFPSEPYYKYHPNTNFGGMKVLNFGCGKSIYKAQNVLNVDVVPDENVVVRDPNRSLKQFGDNFDFILANHVLEHVPDWFTCFAEMAEILKPNGRLEIFIPPISSDSAFSFRDHLNRIGIRSFDGIGPTPTPGCNLLSSVEYQHFTHLRKLINHSQRPCIKWWTMLAWPSLLKFMCQHLRNTVSEEQFLFVKLP